MNPKNKLNLLILAVAIVAIGLACSANQKKANDMVDEANKAINEAKSAQETADKKYNEVTDKINGSFPEGRDEYKAAAQEAVDNYDKAAKKVGEAAAKFDDASKIDTTDKYKTYLTAKANENKKRVEWLQAFKERAQAILDASSFDELKTKVDALTAKINSIDKEASKFGDEAKKIETDNPDIFKK
jgi:uncharacterized protein YoxC